MIAAALNKILKDSGDKVMIKLKAWGRFGKPNFDVTFKAGILAAVEAALQNNDLSLDEINKVLAMNKAMDGGKVRGMKDLQKILDEGSTDSIEGLENLLQEIFNSGVLTPAAVEQAMVFQKAISSSGCNFVHM